MESKGLHRADACSRESTVEYIVEQSKISLKSTKSNLEFTLSLFGIRGGCCNPSYWEDGIRGWHEAGRPPKEVARSLWCLH